MDADTERELCEAVGGGDQEAFRLLYLANVGIVHGYLARRCGRDAADDLAAETFCRAWEKRDSFTWRGLPYRAWLLRIAHNLAVNRWRRNREVTGIEVDRWVEDAPGPEDRLVRDETYAAARAAVARLPDLQREIVELRFTLGLPAVEVAAVLDRSPEAVRAATYRAVLSLRDAMRERDVEH